MATEYEKTIARMLANDIWLTQAVNKIAEAMEIADKVKYGPDKAEADHLLSCLSLALEDHLEWLRLKMKRNQDAINRLT